MTSINFTNRLDSKQGGYVEHVSSDDATASKGWQALVPAAFSKSALAANHAGLAPRLGFIVSIINTPAHHRVHQASDLTYVNKNHGGILIVFDRLFGTTP
ncbi:sterol desaturase family protein [Dyella japonica]|uniref:Sterol desaturase/sphingolipid hydroxylase (Fatty acid hydroxylase superfamily) n=1 Tax=Dyella japonica TaxID=231455 RepID=A0ABV2JP62_9GAMM